MKNQFFLAASLFVSGIFSMQAQDHGSEFLANTSLELGWGYNMATSPTDGIKAGDYAGFKSLYAGAHYQLDDFWGLRATYAYNSFEDKNDSHNGLTFHKFMLESTLNVSKAISGEPTQPVFDLLAHTGLGISIANSELKSGSDNMGNVQVGLMPRYHVTDKISVHLDVTYVINISQNYGFNGAPALIDNKSVTGGYLTSNLGVSLKL